MEKKFFVESTGRLDDTEKQKRKLEPFGRVLVRNKDDEVWKIDFFSHGNFEETPGHPYWCLKDNYTRCIPYEGNEHLLNTTDKPDNN